MSTYPDYLELRKGVSPAPSTYENDIRVWADEDGVLHSIQSDGSDWKAGTGRPGTNVTEIVAPWEASNPSVVMTPDGVTFGPYVDGRSSGGSVRYHGLDGQPFEAFTNLAYKMRYRDDEGELLEPGASPYARVFMQDGRGDQHDVIFTPGSQAYPGLGPGPVQEWVATSGMWRYDDDSGSGGVPIADLQAEHGDEVITKVTITLGFTSGTNLTGLLRWWQINGVTYTFGTEG